MSCAANIKTNSPARLRWIIGMCVVSCGRRVDGFASKDMDVVTGQSVEFLSSGIGFHIT